MTEALRAVLSAVDEAKASEAQGQPAPAWVP
jgi:hypothetical protein